ncbi:MAG TPA: DNA ligase D [Solirubrobacterales bacterium]|jgi:bifunctional non-homologous end joining protein LigD|nr:DNA ligase D [Solirubrobacterales bacterium]
MATNAGKKKGDKLGEYERKRDFDATPEPASKKRRKRKSAPRFVVQEHSARRLHWDLRLEHEGVAASWAVPNGIPADPSENRKAVQTEDHPLEYLDFEGEIPAGEYGAGTMRIWDRGTYEAEKWEEAKIVFSFSGERLSGRYALFRAGSEAKDWMIHRIDPPSEERDPFPESVVPMLAKLSTLPASDDGWAVEVKWDGVRAIAYCRPGRLELQTRNLNEVTAQYPEVRRLSRQLGARDAVLDGELVAFDEQGRPSFERLQQRIHQTAESVVRRRMKSHPVTYVIFDLLYLDGRDLTQEPYSHRRELLEGLELAGESWQTPAYSAGHARELLAASAEQKLEGIVLKRLSSRYAPGKRTGSWLKVKNLGRQEFVIGGWQPGEGRRRNRLGAILLGYFDEDGELHYAGKVGTGFSDRDLDELLERLRPLARKTNPFAGRRGPRAANFVEPQLVAEIEFRELTAEGMVRHGSFKGLREDKPADQVTVERPEPLDSSNTKVVPAGGSRKRATVTVEGRELSLSNLDKVLYPRTGFTKGELIEWYARIGEVLLPHLRGRPLTMKRYPDGVEAGHFYEKRCPKHKPEWVQTANVWSERHGEEIDYCLVEDLPTLVWAANLANVELHTSLSVAAEMERPTAVVFDLDPGAPADVLDCAQVAIWIRGMFEQLGLNAYPKTSGSKGIQVYVPLNTEVTYAQTKPFAKAVAETLEAKFPERIVSQMAKSRRSGRVLIDWSQNDPHKTTVSVYSLRARERPTVSTPLEWDELQGALAESAARLLVFDHEMALQRVEERGDLFAPLLSERQQLPD